MENEDIVIYEAFEEEAEALRRVLPAELNVRITANTIQEEGDMVPPGKVLSIRTQSRIPPEWAGKFDGMLTRSKGYDHLVEYCRNTGVRIPSGYIPDYCSRAVAEHAITMMLLLLRKFKQQMRQFRTFCRDGITGSECGGKNLLVVGVGKIGKIIVSLGHGLGMNVKGVDLDEREDDVQYVSFLKGIGWADVVVCAVPLTEKTNGMFSEDVFQRSRNGLVFINIARGEISSLATLEKFLSEGKLGGVGIDVYEREQIIADFLRSGRSTDNTEIALLKKLLDRDDVVCTPHNAFNTAEAVERKAKKTAVALEQFLRTKTFDDAVPLS